MRILIIRHGDPDYEHDCLTEKGKREATLLAKQLQTEKIDYIYSSPLGRAKETCYAYANAVGRGKEIVVKEWLKEFIHTVTLPSGTEQEIPWDMLPEEWVDQPKMYDYQSWQTQELYRTAGIDEEYHKVVDGLDALLAEHGYVREGNTYRVEKRNRDTLVFFCHFGTEALLLSRLCNISPLPLWHHFVALTTSVTTLYTEERLEGKAVWRCCGFGDIGHLRAGNEPPSFSARFCETYGHPSERQD